MFQTTYIDTFQQETIAEIEKKKYLITRSLDILLLGGASILFFFISLFISQHYFHQYEIKFIFFLNFIVNFPHFLLSYQLLYLDFKHLILKQFHYFWAGVIVPVTLIVLFALAYFFKPIVTLGYFVNALYFFVGWHYIKQIFGTIIVTNALQKYFYSNLERRCLKVNLYSLWSISWVWNNLGNSQDIFEGIIYSSLNIPRYYLLLCFAAIILTLIPVIFLHLKKYFKEKRKPSSAAIISFISSYLWFIPLFYNPIFFPCIAFFHSLQYIPFVYSFRRNKIKSQSKSKDTYHFQHYRYLLLSVVLGAIFFYFLPRYIDGKKLFDFELYGPTLMMFYFVIFLNIHHYFIDSVIWKKNNEEMRKYIFH